MYQAHKEGECAALPCCHLSGGAGWRRSRRSRALAAHTVIRAAGRFVRLRVRGGRPLHGSPQHQQA